MTDEKTTSLATVPAGMEGMISTERPAGADEGTLGSEGMTKEDILMPRLGLAQKMSPEIDPTNAARYIAGLQFTELFHSISKKNYGKGPVYFTILRRDRPRYIEFNPIDQGGGIKDMNVPPGDQRTQFTTGTNGERVKPVATMFYDYIVLLLNDLNMADPMQNIVALSMKSSGIKAAKQLNLLIQQRGKKLLCKGVYKLTTNSATDKKTQGVYAIYEVNNAGWLVPDSDVEKLAISQFHAWEDKSVIIDRDVTPEADPDDSMAANPEDAAPQM